MWGPEDEDEVTIGVDSEGNTAELVSWEDAAEAEDDDYDSQADYDDVY